MGIMSSSLRKHGQVDEGIIGEIPSGATGFHERAPTVELHL
jgi:hypothetical protein